VGDFNRDGKSDLVATNFGSDTVSILLNLVTGRPTVFVGQVTSNATMLSIIPIASGASIDGGSEAVYLTENTTKNVVVTATVSDNNGCSDIDSVSVKFYRTDVGAGAGDAGSNHYTQSASVVGGTCTGGGDLSADYTATIAVQYYADPTDVGSANAGTNWTADVIPVDGGGAGTTSSDTIEMATLTAMSVTATVSYGSIPRGLNTGTADQITTVTNTGNVAIGTQVDGYGATNGDGYASVCATGNIPIANEKYAIIASQDYTSSKTALTDTAANIVTFSVPKSTSAVSSDDVYWGFGVPTSGVDGACTGTIIFTPV
jgi:hypothetical protein